MKLIYTKILIVIVALLSTTFSCNNHKENDNFNIKNQLDSLTYKLKYIEEDANSLAIILSCDTFNYPKIIQKLQANSIAFEYEVIKKPAVLPIVLNNYKLIFSTDSNLVLVEKIVN